jgi:hypothetical protein
MAETQYEFFAIEFCFFRAIMYVVMHLIYIEYTWIFIMLANCN